MFFSFKKNISLRFSVAMISVATVIISGFAVVLVWNSANILETELKKRLSLASTLAKTGLAVSLGENNNDHVHELVTSLFSDEDVMHVSIVANGEVVISKDHPDFSGKDWTFFEQSSSFLRNVSEADYNGKQVGTIRLAVSKKPVQRGLMRRIEVIIALTVVLIAAISLTSVVVTKRYIVQPLSKLVKLARFICEEKLGIPVVSSTEGLRTQDEIGVLGKVFKHMTFYLTDIFTAATHISEGDLSQEITPRSEKDILGNAFQCMTTYLRNMGHFADDVALGDLQNQITPRSHRDQIGVAFFQMREGLISLISQIRSEADALASISLQVLEISSRNAETSDKIGYVAETTSVAIQQVNARAQEIGGSMEHLSSAVEQTGASVEQMIAAIKHIARNSRNLSQFAEDTTTTVLTIVQSLEEIADQAGQSKALSEMTTSDAASGRQSVEQVVDSMTSISEVTKQISESILRLQRRSQEIGTILDVIDEIADKTSLLALNASIIAAQAGVHGRGFAVVANEIKELADRVSTSTQKIAKIVGAVQRDSSEAVSAIKEGHHKVENGVVLAHQAGDALEKIERSAANSSEMAAKIATMVHKQTTAHTDIAQSIRDVSEMIHEITRATHEQEQSSSELFRAVENMQSLGFQVLEATRNQQQGTVYITESMELVLSLVAENSQTVQKLIKSADELTRKADTLRQDVEQFVLPSQEVSSSA